MELLLLQQRVKLAYLIAITCVVITGLVQRVQLSESRMCLRYDFAAVLVSPLAHEFAK